MRFADQVALITAAASGIGRATAEIIGAEGGIVVGVDTDQDRLDALTGAIRAAGGRAHGRRADALDPAQVKATVDGVVREHGRARVPGSIPPASIAWNVTPSIPGAPSFSLAGPPPIPRGNVSPRITAGPEPSTASRAPPVDTANQDPSDNGGPQPAARRRLVCRRRAVNVAAPPARPRRCSVVLDLTRVAFQVLGIDPEPVLGAIAAGLGVAAPDPTRRRGAAAAGCGVGAHCVDGVRAPASPAQSCSVGEVSEGAVEAPSEQRYGRRQRRPLDSIRVSASGGPQVPAS